MSIQQDANTTREPESPNRGESVVKNTVDKQGSTLLNEMPKLTRKQKAFADYLIENPKASSTKAVQETYNTGSYSSAGVQAYDNLKNPKIQKYLGIHADRAENTVIEVMDYSKKLGKTGTREGASYASVALASAKEVLDRVYGKSTQRTEVISKSVSVSIDLTASVDNA